MVVVVSSLNISDIVKGAVKFFGHGFSGTRATDFKDVPLVYDDPTGKLLGLLVLI